MKAMAAPLVVMRARVRYAGAMQRYDGFVLTVLALSFVAVCIVAGAAFRLGWSLLG
jgi:hypothetical protein